MDINMEINGQRGSFFVMDCKGRSAEMTFSLTGTGTLIIDHTEVSDRLRGTGAGKKLVAAAVDFAGKNKLKIMPLCPFAKAVFDKTPEYQPVLF